MAEKTITYFLGVMPLEKNGDHGVEEAHIDEGKGKTDVDGVVSVERPTVKPSCSFCHGRTGGTFSRALSVVAAFPRVFLTLLMPPLLLTGRGAKLVRLSTVLCAECDALLSVWSFASSMSLKSCTG